VVAPAPVLERLAAERVDLDRQGDLAVEMAVAELLEDGEVQRHALRMRRIYAERRGALTEALEQMLPTHLAFDVPAGGMAIWARVHPEIDVDAWASRAEARSVLVQTGRRFTFDGRARPFLRIGFAPLTAEELRDAVRVLRQCATPAEGRLGPPNTLIAAESRPPPHWVATVTVTHHGHGWEASGASLGLFRSEVNDASVPGKRKPPHVLGQLGARGHHAQSVRVPVQCWVRGRRPWRGRLETNLGCDVVGSRTQVTSRARSRPG
jgi:hypothetical protein